MDKKTRLKMEVVAILDEIERVAEIYIDSMPEEMPVDSVYLVADILQEIDTQAQESAMEIYKEKIAQGMTPDEIAEEAGKKAEELLEEHFNSVTPVNKVKKEDLN